MVNFILVLLILLTTLNLHAKVKGLPMDRIHSAGYLGEKNLESYAERYQPLIFQDIYKGKIHFVDELFFQNFFQPYIFQNENDYSFFLRSELNGGLICSNELLSEHFDDIRFSYRLITLSYLLEGQWHLKLMSDHLRLKKGCDFDLKAWIKTCNPKSSEMKKFVQRLESFKPRYDESIPSDYSKNNWWREYSSEKFKWYSQYRLKTSCGGKCSESDLPQKFHNLCEADEKVMTLICSEMDEIYGLSSQRDAYYLLGLSNIINTFNKKGEAMGCLRRFSEVMAHKEVRYDVLKQLFPVLQTFLRERYQERFLQGRVFFYGSGKEFEEKGLKDLYVKEQPIKIEKIPDEPQVSIVLKPKEEPPKKVEEKPMIVKVESPVNKRVPVKEIQGPVKSAFLLASEIRQSGDLERVEVDMLKLKYDYVFTLNMINSLSERLKTFMTREALTEMMTYDKLGTKEGPVPLLFIKYMIDMQEHHGLWNILAVLGDKFYVSNEIDASFKPDVEMIQIVNDESTGRQWQLFVIQP
jgi:hypothetical protein